MERKELLLDILRNTVSSTRDYISSELEQLKERELNLLIHVRKSYTIEQEIAAQQLTYTRRRIEELITLKRSPFFAKVVYHFDSLIKEVYISKYQLTPQDVNNVISWTAPVAEMRFEELGKVNLLLPEKKVKEVHLIQKDSYVIGEDKIVYYSQETEEFGVEIIYEDFLSTVKSEFGLSEIIAKLNMFLLINLEFRA